VAIGAVSAIIAAVLVQDHTQVLPLGLFNEGRSLYRALANLCLGLSLVALALLVADFLRSRTSRFATACRGLLVSLLLLETLLAAVDITLISRNPTSRIGGPYHERRTSSGEWLFLKKSHGGSPFGFRTSRPYTREPDGLRVLFLGDSYTEGSGRGPACNYPDVVESELSRHMGVDVEVLNAGVSGYGPVDALRLLRLLIEEGFRFDAVVYNLFLENDFTDNLPGTERRVVAGINFRFPRSSFLRTFHPLNWRIFRFGVFLRRFGSLSREAAQASRSKPGDCVLDPEPLPELTPWLRSLVERRLAATRRVTQSQAATGEITRAVSAMQSEAIRQNTPLVLLLFPERILVDPELQKLLRREGPTIASAETLRSFVRQTFADLPLIDTTPLLEGRAGLYRAVDTHLSDLGNVTAGRFVALRLADVLGRTGGHDVSAPHRSFVYVQGARLQTRSTKWSRNPSASTPVAHRIGELPSVAPGRSSVRNRSPSEMAGSTSSSSKVQNDSS
jgi:hypothetical protein